MGKTSAAVKNRYINKAYDRFGVIFPKGKKEVYRAAAEAEGLSLNALINKLLEEHAAKPQNP